MRPDVRNLERFYASPLGQMARRKIAARIRQFWPGLEGLTLAGLGYATPYLQDFDGEAQRIAALMPAAQGANRWPTGRPSRVALVESARLPLPAASFDRIILAHSLEISERAGPLLREIWRVLAPEGRLIIIVPNRRGMWARTERTPFGYGRPYSRRQLHDLLAHALFTPLATAHCLFIPPVRLRTLQRSAPVWEALGRRLWPGLSGVLMVEARKEIYGAIPSDALRARAEGVVIAPVSGALRASTSFMRRKAAGMRMPYRRGSTPKP